MYECTNPCQSPASPQIKKEKEEGQVGSNTWPSYALGVRPYKAIKLRAETIMNKVAIISSVAEATIRAAYKDLFPHIAQLLPPQTQPPAGLDKPDDRITPEILAKLPNPDPRNNGGIGLV